MYKRVLICLLAALLAGCGRKNAVQQMQTGETVACTENTIQTDAAMETEASVQTVPSEEPIPEEPLQEPAPETFVRVLEWIPQMYQDLRYAGTDNFTGQQIYPFYEAYLRYGTVQKLQKVNDELARQGLSLKIWDAYRPASAQWTLWQVCPNPAFVANPERGFSGHTRGNTVDVTLVNSSGQELEMPSGFDEFSARADRNYSDCTDLQAANARLLEQVMERYGFVGYAAEWWHFSDSQSYPVEENFEPPLG